MVKKNINLIEESTIIFKSTAIYSCVIEIVWESLPFTEARFVVLSK